MVVQTFSSRRSSHKNGRHPGTIAAASDLNRTNRRPRIFAEAPKNYKHSYSSILFPAAGDRHEWLSRSPIIRLQFGVYPRRGELRTIKAIPAAAIKTVTGTKRRCFVIMPFSTIRGVCTEKEWTSIFEHLIKPSVEQSGLGYSCTRSSPDFGNLMKQIIVELNDADVLIADLTGQNANVFYELGIRHALRGRTILLAQAGRFIPSDLRAYSYHIYDRKTSRGKRKFRKRIKELLEKLDLDPTRKDNPVEDFLGGSSIPPTLHYSRLSTDVQRSAAYAAMRQYSERLDSIQKGQIPIDSGAEYFSHFMRSIDKNKACEEEVRIFASLRNLEIADGFRKFNRAQLFGGLAKAAREKRIKIEYIVFLTEPSVAAQPQVMELLHEYTRFAHGVYVAFASNIKVSPPDTERTIVLLSDHKWAFTHTWNIHADVVDPMQWISKEVYEKFDKTYERLKMHALHWSIRGKVMYSGQKTRASVKSP
jgi:hypothetical protein